VQWTGDAINLECLLPFRIRGRSTRVGYTAVTASFGQPAAEAARKCVEDSHDR
jgi:hypothetical protein